MDAGERLAGMTIGAGDVIFVHSGIERRERAQGAEDPEVRPGLAAEAISWLSERDIAVYSGDCSKLSRPAITPLYRHCT